MNENRAQINAVLFDWDFTLAFTLERNLSYIERTAALFKQCGVTYPIEAFRTARQTLLRDIALGRVDGAIKPQTKQDIIWFYQQLLERLGHPDTSTQLAYNIYIAYAQLPTTLYEDVLPTLKFLQNNETKLGILTNHSTTVRPTIEKFLGRYISSGHITISEEVGLHKPSHDIFRMAAESISEEPDRCLYVGDNLDIDAIGSVRHGEYGLGLWLDRLDQNTMQDLPASVVRINTLQQVLDFVPMPG